MKKTSIILVILLLLASLVILLLTNRAFIEKWLGKPESKVTEEQQAGKANINQPVSSSHSIVAACQLVPRQSAQLSFSTGGVLKSMEVKEGMVVSQGDLLARLDGQKQAEASLVAAQRELMDAEQALEKFDNEIFLAVAEALKKLRDAELAEKNAVSQLDRLKDARKSDEEIAQAEAVLGLARAQVSIAREHYNKIKNGDDEESRAAIEIRLSDAQARVEAAREALAARELIAPFGGTIVQVYLNPGEYAAPGTPVLLLADLGKFQVQTTNLTEINILEIKPGQSAKVVFDALTNTPIESTVSYIRPLGKNSQGDVVYTVFLDGAFTGKGLLWGMTCTAEIQK